MNWHEDLPEFCPPDDVFDPNGDEYYRLCKDNPAVSSDFCSQKSENSTRKFAGISECILSSVSIWNDKNKCLAQKKYPTQKNKRLGKIILNPNDGKIKNTFKPNHFSWWRSESFDFNSAIVI
nr:hypothetical protein [uncultured Psychroserpens sp.]